MKKGFKDFIKKEAELTKRAYDALALNHRKGRMVVCIVMDYTEYLVRFDENFSLQMLEKLIPLIKEIYADNAIIDTILDSTTHPGSTYGVEEAVDDLVTDLTLLYKKPNAEVQEIVNFMQSAGNFRDISAKAKAYILKHAVITGG